MKIWNDHTIQEILKSIEMEIAKAQNEVKCAKADVEKASNRLAFVSSAIQHLNNKDIKE